MCLDEIIEQRYLFLRLHKNSNLGPLIFLFLTIPIMLKKAIQKAFVIIILTFPVAIFAQQSETLLTHEMSPEEALNKGSIGKAFVETPPPFANIRNVAEFEPMEGALVRYPFGIPYPLIAEMSQNTIVWTIANGASAIATVTTNYTSNGVNLANCRFINANSNSYWTRDFGPWFIQYSDSNYIRQTAIVDFPYNRPRPLDDEIPKIVADSLNLPWFGMNVIHTGGNYMTSGMGKSTSTDLTVVENPTPVSYTHLTLPTNREV